MPLPAQVTYATVNAVLMSAVADSNDIDLLPDAIPLAGSVTFTPDRVNGQVMLPAATPPMMLTVRPMKFSLAVDGSLSANLVVIPGATYTVSFDLGLVVKITSFSIGPLVAGTTYDLSALAPVVAKDGLAYVISPASDTSIATAINTAGSATRVALTAAFVSRWQPMRAYLAGAWVLNPSGQIVSALANFTSGAAYVSGDWSLPSGGTTSVAAADNTVTVGGTASAVTLRVTGGVYDAAGAAAAAQTASAIDATNKVAAETDRATTVEGTLQRWKADFTTQAAPLSIVQGSTGVLLNQVYFGGYVRYNPSNILGDGAIWVADLSAGTWTLDTYWLANPGGAIVTVDISYNRGVSWTTLSSQDLHDAAASVAFQGSSVAGIVVPTSGAAWLRFRSLSKNVASTGFYYFISNAVMSRTA